MSLTTGLATYWKCEDTSEATGGGYTLSNNNSVSFTAGILGNCADFGTSNTNKSLTTTSKETISTQSNVTVSMWIKMRTEIASGDQWCFNLSDTNGYIYLGYEYNGGTRRVTAKKALGGSGAVGAYKTATLGTSSWHHLVLTYDGTTVQVYLDNVAGTSATQAGGSFAYAHDRTTIGAGRNEVNDSFFGYCNMYISDVAIYNRVLSTGEIGQLYDSGAGLRYPFSVFMPASNPMTNFLQAVKRAAYY